MIDTVPDRLRNLKRLFGFYVYNTKIVRVTEELTKLSEMAIITLYNCSLTSLPNLSNLTMLIELDVAQNNLTDIVGIPGVQMLFLRGNQLRQIPITDNPDELFELDMTENPLSSAAAIMSYKNVEYLRLSGTGINSIPVTIDKLRNVHILEVANNKLTRLPTNVLNLRKLQELNIENNLLPTRDVESIRRSFKKSHPNLNITC